jgi:hypothetical protein
MSADAFVSERPNARAFVTMKKTKDCGHRVAVRVSTWADPHHGVDHAFIGRRALVHGIHVSAAVKAGSPIAARPADSANDEG